MDTIKPGKFVELVYQVKAVDADGNTFTMEFTEQRPDKFVYGVEQGLIDKLEKSLLGMEQGAEINLVMTPEETAKEFGDLSHPDSKRCYTQSESTWKDYTQDGLNKVVRGETSFEEIIKLIDLEDDLGTNTNLGLKETLNDSEDVNSNSNLETLDI